MRELLQTTVADYLLLNDTEAGRLAPLVAYLNETNDDPASHKNFEGHVTASIFVMTLGRKVLLLHHKRLGKRLQPGGHVDPMDATPFDAALRELEEETGIARSALTHRSTKDESTGAPFHIDVQLIPSSTSRDEPAHYHYDFEYLATVSDESDVTIDSSESNGSDWVDWDEFRGMEIFSRQSAKIDVLLDQAS